MRNGQGHCAGTCRNGGADGGDAAADENLGPLDAVLLERGEGNASYPARLGLRREAQGLARVVCEAGGGHPAKAFFKYQVATFAQMVSVASTMVPSRIIKPFSAKCPLIVSKIWRVRPMA